jgi:hypothetical protein
MLCRTGETLYRMDRRLPEVCARQHGLKHTLYVLTSMSLRDFRVRVELYRMQ